MCGSLLVQQSRAPAAPADCWHSLPQGPEPCLWGLTCSSSAGCRKTDSDSLKNGPAAWQGAEGTLLWARLLPPAGPLGLSAGLSHAFEEPPWDWVRGRPWSLGLVLIGSPQSGGSSLHGRAPLGQDWRPLPSS